MNDKTEAQPEALRLAALLDNLIPLYDESDVVLDDAAVELRRQHAKIHQLKAQLAARQAVPGGWKLVPKEATRLMLDAMPPVEEDGYWAMYEAALSAAPPPPEREPLTLAQIDGIGDATGKPSFTWHYEFARAIERAHGIGTTNETN